MTELVISYGYYGMFIMGFLAATVLPLGSEWLLIILLIKGLDVYGVVLAASLGNYIGACTTYLLGYAGSEWLTDRVFKIEKEKRVRSRRIYEKYGAVSLLFSWVPVVGDPLCFVSGVMRYSFVRFSLLVFTGKLARYAFLAYITMKSAEYLAK